MHHRKPLTHKAKAPKVLISDRRESMEKGTLNHLENQLCTDLGENLTICHLGKDQKAVRRVQVPKLMQQRHDLIQVDLNDQILLHPAECKKKEGRIQHMPKTRIPQMTQVNPRNNPLIQLGTKEDVEEEEDGIGKEMTVGVIEVEEEEDIKDNTLADGNTKGIIEGIYFLEENI